MDNAPAAAPQRETKNITTPSGVLVVLKTFLTGGEANKLKELLFADVKLGMDDLAAGAAKLADVPASVIAQQEKEALKLAVVSIAGAADKVIERLEQLPEADYNFVVEEVNKIRAPFKREK